MKTDIDYWVIESSQIIVRSKNMSFPQKKITTKMIISVKTIAIIIIVLPLHRLRWSKTPHQGLIQPQVTFITTNKTKISRKFNNKNLFNSHRFLSLKDWKNQDPNPHNLPINILLLLILSHNLSKRLNVRNQVKKTLVTCQIAKKVPKVYDMPQV